MLKLEKGKIYYEEIENHQYISEYDLIDTPHYIVITSNYFKKAGEKIKKENVKREASLEECHWLNCCIQADKFIPYEEAMKTFNQEPFCIELNSQEELDAIMSFYKEKGYEEYGNSHTYKKGYVVIIKPEYKEWQTAVSSSKNYPIKTLSELGIVVKPKSLVGRYLKALEDINVLNKGEFDLIYKEESNHVYCVKSACWSKNRFNIGGVFELMPEGFIPEEETSVLPEKWYCKRTKENSKILNKWNNENYKDSYAFCEKGEGCIYSDKEYCGVNLNNFGEDYIEITFEQFKKYVLKEDSVFPVEKIEKRIQELKQPLLTPKECYTEDVIEIGDEVEMISHNPIDGFGDVEVGDKGIVKSITIDRYIIDFPNHSEWAGLASELKLIKKASKSIFISKPVKSSNKPELIPIKVRNVSTFVPQKRIKTTIIKPKLITI